MAAASAGIFPACRVCGLPAAWSYTK
jgi:hypothetical protein